MPFNSIPTDYFCPLCKTIMTDPVVAADGFTYERKEIEAWFTLHDQSPKTNEILTSKILLPNTTLKNIIDAYNLKITVDRNTQTTPVSPTHATASNGFFLEPKSNSPAFFFTDKMYAATSPNKTEEENILAVKAVIFGDMWRQLLTGLSLDDEEYKAKCFVSYNRYEHNHLSWKFITTVIGDLERSNFAIQRVNDRQATYRMADNACNTIQNTALLLSFRTPTDKTDTNLQFEDRALITASSSRFKTVISIAINGKQEECIHPLLLANPFCLTYQLINDERKYAQFFMNLLQAMDIIKPTEVENMLAQCETFYALANTIDNHEIVSNIKAKDAKLKAEQQAIFNEAHADRMGSLKK